MFRENYHCGHYQILRSYCRGVPLPIPGRLQSGWSSVCPFETSLAREPWPLFVWSSRDRERCQNAGFRRVLPIGSPWLYLPPKPDRLLGLGARSLLANPIHAWSKAQLESGMRSYADALMALAQDGFSPISVCLSWSEFEDEGLRHLFESRGFRVTTLGPNDNNPGFLHNQRAILARHAYVTTNRASSVLFYALSSGQKAFLYGPSAGLSSEDPKGEAFAAWQQQQFSRLLYANFGDVAHQDIAFDALGLEHKRTSEELEEFLLWSTPTLPKLAGHWLRRELWRLSQDAL